MVSTEQQFILFLLRKSHGIEANPVVFLEDVHDTVKYILKNGILLTVYPAIQKLAQEDQSENSRLAQLQSILQEQYYAAVKQSIKQKHEGEIVLSRLSDAGLCCIALKGWELCKFYPYDTMRQMADLDVLVRPYAYSKIVFVMKRLGFVGDGESSWKHDSFRKGEVHVEMHKRLTDDSKHIQKWEREMWTRAIPVHGNIYKMAPEDFYIFHFVHLHKDFMNGSLGLRRIVDTWLLQKQTFDMAAVKDKLEQFELWKFHERMCQLGRVVMGDIPIDENCEILLSHAFTYGIYGSNESYKAGRIVSMGKNLKTGKIRSAIAAVFLPYKRMKAQFPVLEKWPILLPACWIRRIIHFMCGDMKRNRERLNYSNVDDKAFQEMDRFFKAGGVR